MRSHFVFLGLALVATVVVAIPIPANVATATAAADVLIESFDSPQHQWKEMNDPVMGGESTGTTTIANDLLVFNGTVVNVPKLAAPGFITSEARDTAKWADVSSCKALAITLRSTVKYAGYRVSFGDAHATSCHKFFARGYKSPLTNVPIGDFGTIVIPFDSFSDCWDDATGKIITSCADNAKFCPPKAALEDMKMFQFWGEGVGGDVHLEVKNISGTQCA